MSPFHVTLRSARDIRILDNLVAIRESLLRKWTGWMGHAMQTVTAILRYPLKSARGEALDVADVEPGGLRGDRIWACIDCEDGTVGSARHPARWGRLLDVRTRLQDDVPDPVLTVEVDGSALRAGSAEADAALSRYLARPLRLSRDIPPDAKLHRRLPDEIGMLPDWTDGAPGQETVTPMETGAVHIVTTGALAQLRRRMWGTEVAAVRFRPNLVLDAPQDPVPGQELRIGEVVLRVVMPTPRCVVPGLGSAELPPDRALPKTLARHYRVPVGRMGRAACFGTYAEVVRPGRLHVGQSVR
jgi:hypothetical protein